MAKTEGTQSVPSALLDKYRATLGEQRPDKTVEKRYPYRLPTMQAGKSNETAAQRIQRDRFKSARDLFNTISSADRARWYAARPPWSSYLWYYNYFILSDLTGNANVDQGGAGVIKSIQVMKASVPTTGGHTFVLGTGVDATKTVAMLFGSGRKVPKVVRGTGSVATAGTDQAHGGTIDPDKCTVKLFGSSYYPDQIGDAPFAWNVFPYIFALTSSNIHIKWSITAFVAANVSWEITEHVEGAVWPVLVSISNTEVDVDWAEEPDAAAEVSILVIEYI